MSRQSLLNLFWECMAIWIWQLRFGFASGFQDRPRPPFDGCKNERYIKFADRIVIYIENYVKCNYLCDHDIIDYVTVRLGKYSDFGSIHEKLLRSLFIRSMEAKPRTFTITQTHTLTITKTYTWTVSWTLTDENNICQHVIFVLL